MSWQPTDPDRGPVAVGPLALARLSVYRAAVHARCAAESGDATGQHQTFSEPEHVRLMAYRAAVRAGFYHDGTAA